MSRTLLAATLLAVSFLSVMPVASADERAGTEQAAKSPGTLKSLAVGPAIDAPFRKGFATREPIQFVDIPLREAIEFLADVGDLPVVIDRRALEEEGIPLDQRVDQLARDTPIRTVLDRVLAPLRLTWIVKNEVIVVTTRTAADGSANLQRVVYNVRPLLEAFESVKRDVVTSKRTYPEPTADLFGSGQTSDGTDDLIEAIVRMTGLPDAWEDQGGPGSVVVTDGMLIVRANQAVQREVDGLLTSLSAVVSGDPHAAVVRTLDTPENQRARAAYDKKVSVDLYEVSLNEAVEFLAELVRVEITLDRFALEEEGIPVDEPVTAELKDASLRSALSRLLEPLSLTAVVRHGAIEITSKIVSEEYGDLETVVCDMRPDIAPGSGEEVEIADLMVRMIGEPGSWADQGGSGDVVWLPGGLLVVRQQQRNTREIESLFAELRALPRGPERKRPKDDDVLLLDYTLTAGEASEAAKLVETFVAPKSWQQDEHVIRPVGRQLFVRTTYANHVKIDALLSKLDGHSSSFGGGSFGLDVITPD